jgi:hypothetical protein
MNLFVTIKLEPWYLGLIEINKAWLYQEFIRGTISREDAKECLGYTIEAGSKLGMRVK